MIAFSKLGNYGRLGNQLFQYAFLRSTAERLGTTFYCPEWDGDAIFDLNDSTLRAKQPEGLVRAIPAPRQAGFSPEALAIQDGSDIEGYFQSEKLFASREAVLSWYSFKKDIMEGANHRLDGIDLQNSVSISLRLDDDYASTREYFPLYPRSYYENALSQARPYDKLIVFADRPDRARNFLSGMKGDKVFIEGAPASHQLYLMSKCRDNVITNSTFAWWGAWLNANSNRQVFAPSHWCRPGVPNSIVDITPEDWTRVRGTHPISDHFIIWRLTHPVATFSRVMRKLLPEK